MQEPRDRVLIGVALMLGFCLTAPMIDVFAKLATQRVSVGQVTLARFSVQAALMLPLVRLMGLPLRYPRAVTGLVVARAAVAVLFTSSFVAAVSVMPIANALSIVFVAPFILLLIGKLFLGEAVGAYRVVAALAGFAGALFVIRPGLAALGPVALLPLSTAVFFALYLLITRRLSPLIHPVPMQAHTALAALAFVVPLLWAGAFTDIAPLSWTPPAGVFWLYLLGVGVAATVSHMAITLALRFAPSTTLAPLQYLEIVTAVVAGYLVFGNFPAPLTWTGIAIIIGAGIYVIHRERLAAQAPPGRHPGSRAAE